MSRTITIGVLSPMTGGSYYGKILAGITREVAAVGGRVVLVQTLHAGLRSDEVVGAPDFVTPTAWEHIDGVISIATGHATQLSRSTPGRRQGRRPRQRRDRGIRRAVGDAGQLHRRRRDRRPPDLARPHTRSASAPTSSNPTCGPGTRPTRARSRRTGSIPTRSGSSAPSTTASTEVATSRANSSRAACPSPHSSSQRIAMRSAAWRNSPSSASTFLAMWRSWDSTGWRTAPTPSRRSRPCASRTTRSVRRPHGSCWRSYVATTSSSAPTCRRRSSSPADHADALARTERWRPTVEPGSGATRHGCVSSGATRRENSMREQYEIGIQLLDHERADPRSLEWLAATDVRGACLALWDGDPSTGRLRIVGAYDPDDALARRGRHDVRRRTVPAGEPHRAGRPGGERGDDRRAGQRARPRLRSARRRPVRSTRCRPTGARRTTSGPRC